MLFKSVMDQNSTENSVKNSDGCITRKNRAPERRKTTGDWELLIEWANGIMARGSLSDTKGSLPAQAA